MTSYSIITPTSLGTGVARTSLGTNVKPAESQSLIEFIPYYAPSGAVTAGQSFLLATEITSTSVKDILPKRITNPPIQATLGATAATMIPILEPYECSTPLTQGSNDIIEAFGQAQVANTVAPVMGCALHYSDSPPSRPQMFYEKPDNETSTGTAATTVNGNTMTINGGKTLQVLMGQISAGTVLASESYIASLQFNSANFDNSQDLEIPLQPVSVGLAGLNSALQPKTSIYKNVSMGMKLTSTIATILRLSEALTNAGNFIGGIGYTKV